MCGSVTFLIEAAMIAMGIPPGMYRRSFGFELWPDFDEKLFADIYNAEHEKEFMELIPPFESGLIVTNPPYGERLKPKSLIDLYSSFGDTLKQKFSGYTAWLISSSDEGLKSIGLKPSRKIELYNGALACSYRCFELFRGSRKEKILIRKVIR